MDGTEEAAESVAIGECRAIVDLEKPNVRRGPGEASWGELGGLGVFVNILHVGSYRYTYVIVCTHTCCVHMYVYHCISIYTIIIYIYNYIYTCEHIHMQMWKAQQPITFFGYCF